MAPTVDGLVSGLDTTTIVSQLMQLQALPQARMKTSLQSAQSAILGFQTVNTKMTALQSAAEKLMLGATWTASTATSSATSVSATASPNALPGSTTFSVTALASAKSVVSSQTYTSLSDTTATVDTVFEIHDGPDGSGVLRASITSDGSLSSLVSAINNSPTSGLRAAAVQVSSGVYKLQLTSTDTGSAKDFSLTAAAGAPVSGLTLGEVSPARDAVLHVGAVGSGFDITSGTNTIEGVMPGLTVKVSALVNDVTVSTAQDTTSITGSVQALVDAANAALTTIKSQSTSGVLNSAGTARIGAGPLAGDSQMRTLTNRIMSVITGGIGGASLKSVGISTTKDGAITFDASVFTAALTKDTAATKAMFSTVPAVGPGTGAGLAELLTKVGKDASSSTGSLTTAITGRNSTISDLTSRIADWDVRLASRKAALQRQYSSLEVALGKLKSQSTWLAGQVNALDNNRSN